MIANRLRGQVDAPQQPIVTYEEADIAAYGASSIADLIASTAPQTGSGRGRGGGHPAILFNGQRIANFREFRNIPPEAIRRMEVLPEEVALRYGFPANQRVINFILKDNFASKSIDAEYHLPTRGGFAEDQFEATLLKINKESRLNLYARANNASMLTEAERGVIQQPGTQPTVSGDPDPAQFRSLVPDTKDYIFNASWTTGLGKDGLAGSLGLSAGFTRNDSRSISGLDTVVLTAPGGATALRTLGDPLTRRSRNDSFQGGVNFNKRLGGWRLTATLDGTHADNVSRIDRRADTSALVAAASAGTLAIAGPLPALAAAPVDGAKATSNSLTSLVTLAGSPLRMKAGDVSATIKAGFAYSGIRSEDTRSQAGDDPAEAGRSQRRAQSWPADRQPEERCLAGAGRIVAQFQRRAQPSVGFRHAEGLERGVDLGAGGQAFVAGELSGQPGGAVAGRPRQSADGDVQCPGLRFHARRDGAGYRHRRRQPAAAPRAATRPQVLGQLGAAFPEKLQFAWWNISATAPTMSPAPSRYSFRRSKRPFRGGRSAMRAVG